MNRKFLFLTTALISCLTVSHARAGFEWNPPPAKAPAAQAASAPANNSSDDAGGPLTPMPGEMAMAATAKVEPVQEADIMDNGNMIAPVTQTQPGMKTSNGASSNNSESDLMLPVPGEMAAAPMISAPQAAQVEGFGKDIPLAVALRQVVPPAYTVSFDSGVDQGKPVSWKGGAAWTQVVSDMLKTRKLHAVMSANTVIISKGAGADLQMTAPPAPVMAQNEPLMNSGMNAGKPVLDMSLQQKWTAPAGQSLKQTLQNWSGQAHVELAWQDANDAPINSAFSYDGTFDQAVDALLSLYNGDNNEPHGKLYPNLPEGPSVLVVGSN